MQNKEPQLILVGGLPGSGKSCHVAKLEAHGWAVFDDFQKCAINNDPSFKMVRQLPELLETLRRGKRCVVADVRLVTADYRADVLRVLRREIPELSVELRVFERDDHQCVENINNSPDPRDAPGRLRILGEFGPLHSVPREAARLSVWRPSASPSS